MNDRAFMREATRRGLVEILELMKDAADAEAEGRFAEASDKDSSASAALVITMVQPALKDVQRGIATGEFRTYIGLSLKEQIAEFNQ